MPSRFVIQFMHNLFEQAFTIVLAFIKNWDYIPILNQKSASCPAKRACEERSSFYFCTDSPDETKIHPQADGG
jgi:hypothetical protein